MHFRRIFSVVAGGLHAHGLPYAKMRNVFFKHLQLGMKVMIVHEPKHFVGSVYILSAIDEYLRNIAVDGGKNEDGRTNALLYRGRGDADEFQFRQYALALGF